MTLESSPEIGAATPTPPSAPYPNAPSLASQSPTAPTPTPPRAVAWSAPAALADHRRAQSTPPRLTLHSLALGNHLAGGNRRALPVGRHRACPLALPPDGPPARCRGNRGQSGPLELQKTLAALPPAGRPVALQAACCSRLPRLAPRRACARLPPLIRTSPRCGGTSLVARGNCLPQEYLPKLLHCDDELPTLPQIRARISNTCSWRNAGFWYGFFSWKPGSSWLVRFSS